MQWPTKHFLCTEKEWDQSGWMVLSEWARRRNWGWLSGGRRLCRALLHIKFFGFSWESGTTEIWHDLTSHSEDQSHISVENTVGAYGNKDKKGDFLEVNAKI